ncbi:hypothetical protein BDV10DRAFT_183747 [Aspergillus recurvatus]
MHISSKYIVWLALFLGLAAHAVARALPPTLHEPEAGAETDSDLTLVRRIKLPSKSPVKDGATGGASTTSNTLGGLDPPSPVIISDSEAKPPSNSNSNPKGDQETIRKARTRARPANVLTMMAARDGLEPPPRYSFTKMANWGKDRQTKIGLVDWRPDSVLENANGELRRNSLNRKFNEQLSNFAKKIYLDLKNHKNDPAWKTKGVSTIPRGNAATILYNNYKQRAPGLARATEESRTLKWPNNMHAEDGVIYQEEATRFREGQKILSGPDDRFPEGSRIALYGSWNPISVNNEKHVIPCRGIENPDRVVSCERAVNRLGIDIIGDDYNIRPVADGA